MTPRNTSNPDVSADSASDSISLESGTFNVREFARTAQGTHRGELDLEAIAASGIDGDAIRLLRLLRDLERTTMQRMRNLLVTATHKDARVTAFLGTWAYEKFWLADALDAVLQATGDDLHTSAPAGGLRRLVKERQERRGPVRRAIQGMFDGPHIVAAHVTTGLVDEWITEAAYRRLGELASDLQAVVSRVIAVKDRHILFLSEEAHRRLSVSPRAIELTRRELTQAVWPIGAVERSDDDRSFFERVVFGSDAGRAEAGHIGTLIAALPGLPSVAPSISARLIP